MSLQTLSQPAAPPPRVAVPPKPRRRAPELRYLPLELLTAAASHRTGVGHYLDHQESSSAAGGLQRADRHAHSAPATSLPPLGASVEQAVAPQGGGGGTGGGKSESSLERGYSDQRAFK
eukprot:scaffold144834_cov84-Phaeocystis_antarctica.AAC.1